MAQEPLVAELERLVHNHIRLVDSTRAVLVKAKKVGDASLLDARARKLMEVSQKLETVLRGVERVLEKLKQRDEYRERLELLLFFLYEVGLNEEARLWKAIVESRDALKDAAVLEVAEFMASRSENLRKQVSDLLEKVKS